jgi:putative sigma-54 modulation protein
MDVKVNFKNMDHSEALESMINKKSKKLGKFLKDDAQVTWTCSVEDKAHQCEVLVSNHGNDFHAKDSTEDMYKTLDTVVSKLENQLQHAKR